MTARSTPIGPPPTSRAAFRRAMSRVDIDLGDRFPWRSSRDPYVLLLAEVLLQRTRGPNVAAHFKRIVSEFGSAADLAGASVDRIAAAIAPLGLKKRAAILKRMGEQLVHRHAGSVPTEYEELLALSGVGPYAANAVKCFGFGERAPIVDAGVARVLRRCFALPEDQRVNADSLLWGYARTLLPRKEVARYNFALLTVAQTNCLTKPRCTNCALNSACSFARAASAS
jgi:A/G-specific adenine glycosylase